jgi:TolB-like protein/Flp pilus assembly protein TadD
MARTQRLQQLLGELRRRKVIRVAIVYAVVAWVLIQVAEATFAPLQLPQWTLTLVVVLAIFGFPISVALAWAFEVTPEGVRRERADDEPDASAASPAEPDETVEPAVAAATRTGDAPSIAVLPFLDMSRERDQEYFCEGMAEEILNALTRIEGLRVAARTSSFRFKGQAEDVRNVGRELAVNTVLEGSVRKSGDRLRVTAQLISAADGYHLWSERYDRGLEDVFAIQDEIATKITEALELRLTRRDRDAIHGRTKGAIQAYDYYLRGRHAVHQFGKRPVEYAIQMFEKAIAIDPDYAPAYAGLTLANAQMYMVYDAGSNVCAAAERASARAIELDPDSAEAHTTRGIVELMINRFDAAEQAFERAIALDPRSFDAHFYYAQSHATRGSHVRAAELYEKAAEVRPEDYQALLICAQSYRSVGRMDAERSAAERGLVRARRTLELNPDDVRALYLGAVALYKIGRAEEGKEWAERALALEPDEPSVLYNVACYYARAGDYERSMDLLERAVLPGSANRVWMEHDSDLDALRELPRFKAYLARTG